MTSLFIIAGVVIVGGTIFLVLSRGREAVQKRSEKAFEAANWAEVIKFNKAFLKRNPEDGQALFRLGIAYLRKDLPMQAAQYFKIIIDKALFGDEVTAEDVYEQYAETTYRMGRLEAAAKYFSLLLKSQGANAHYYVRLGQIFFEHQQYSEAVKNLKKALALGSTESCSFLLGMAYFMTGKQDEAFKHLRDARDRESHEDKLYYPLGEIYFHRQDYDQAESCLTESIRRKKKIFKCRMLLGEIAFNRGDHDRAVHELETAIETTVENEKNIEQLLEARHRLMNIHMTAGRVSQAVEFAEFIHRRNPGFKGIADTLGVLKALSGDENLERLLTMDAGNYGRTCESFLQYLKYRQDEKLVESPQRVLFKCTYKEGNELVDCLVRFDRTLGFATESVLQPFLKMIRSQRVYKGLYFSLAGFTEEAMEFSAKWPIELVDGRTMTKKYRSFFMTRQK